jgi:hypothetical protein
MNKEKTEMLKARRIYRLCCSVETVVSRIGYSAIVQHVLTEAVMSRRQYYESFATLDRTYDAMHKGLCFVQHVTGVNDDDLLSLPYPSCELIFFARGIGHQPSYQPIVSYKAARAHAEKMCKGIRDIPPLEAFAKGTLLRSWCDNVENY